MSSQQARERKARMEGRKKPEKNKKSSEEGEGHPRNSESAMNDWLNKETLR